MKETMKNLFRITASKRTVDFYAQGELLEAPKLL